MVSCGADKSIIFRQLQSVSLFIIFAQPARHLSFVNVVDIFVVSDARGHAAIRQRSQRSGKDHTVRHGSRFRAETRPDCLSG